MADAREHALDLLLEHVAASRITAAVAAPYAPYLRALWCTRPREPLPQELEEPIDVPLRLFPRVLTVSPGEALKASRLREAIAIERAAVAAGRTMSEYALLFAAVL
jgi:hypothetical protein